MYAYRCTQCGHKFEKIQNFSAEPESECSKCHGVLERPLTAPGLNFKGAGWYVNDYAPKSSSSGSDSESKSDSKSDSKLDSTSDSKSDSKSDSASAAKDAKPASGGSNTKASTPAKPATSTSTASS